MTTTTPVPALMDSQARNQRLVVLLERCAQQDQSAFEELYRLSSAQLFGVLLRILRMDAIAEEALQESFVKIWGKASTYKVTAGNPMTWMSSIARNQAMDILRQRRTRESNESADLSGIIEATPDTTKSLQDMSDDATLLMKCLDQLPENIRNCVVWAYCEGYSQEELAERSDTPVGTVKSWLHRSLISLRKCVNEHA